MKTIFCYTALLGWHVSALGQGHLNICLGLFVSFRVHRMLNRDKELKNNNSEFDFGLRPAVALPTSRLARFNPHNHANTSFS